MDWRTNRQTVTMTQELRANPPTLLADRQFDYQAYMLRTHGPTVAVRVCVCVRVSVGKWVILVFKYVVCMTLIQMILIYA